LRDWPEKREMEDGLVCYQKCTRRLQTREERGQDVFAGAGARKILTSIQSGRRRVREVGVWSPRARAVVVGF